MTDPESKRGCSVVDLILVVLMLVLIFVLYILFGGDWANLSRLGQSTGAAGPFDYMLESLSRFGAAIQNALSGLIR